MDTGECVTQSLAFDSSIEQIEFEASGKYLIVITSTQLAAVSWEPFELLAQVSHSNTAVRVLDARIDKERLIYLSITRDIIKNEPLEVSNFSINSTFNFHLQLTSVALSVSFLIQI